MSTSALSERISRALVDFAWDEWAQMGVFATPHRPPDLWAQDPEALLVFTLDVARDEPRLFDEVLDWLQANSELLGGRRLTQLSRADREGEALVRASVAWAAQYGSSLRIGGPPGPSSASPIVLSRTGASPWRVDELFQTHGFLKPPTKPSGKSMTPSLDAPINFAFRLRRLFGIGGRAEIIRFLLTSGVTQATTRAIAEAAVSTKRNVNDALTELASAGVISRVLLGNEARYSIDRRRWAALLDIDELAIPSYRNWPSLLQALSEVNRWVAPAQNAEYTDYQRASEARQLIKRVAPLLTRAGVAIVDRGLGEEYWPSFVATIDNAMAQLAPLPSRWALES